MDNAKSLLDEIFNDSRVGGRVLSAFIQLIVKNPERFVDSTESLRNILEHPAVDASMLNSFVHLGRRSVLETIADSRRLLEEALGHDQVNQMRF